jgi:hypothetical protein
MDAGNFLMGSGAKSAKFDNVGDEAGGIVAREPEVRQQTDFKLKTPKFWPDGNPMNQLVVVIKTDQRDPSDPQDNGERSLYIKGKQYTAAVRDAVKAVGAPGIEVGGYLAVKRTGSQRGVEGDPYTFSAIYRRPTSTAATSFLEGNQAAAPAAPPDMSSVLAQLSPEQQQALLAQARQQPSNTAPPF